MANDGEVERFAVERNSRQALDDLFSATYAELRRLAAAVSRMDRHATINPTLLVNEAWLKLAGSPPAGSVSRLHFKRIAARAMRQVLVEAARRRRARKRGDGAPTVVLEDVAEPASGDPEHLLALDAALHRLERLSVRQAAIVESRFFGGLETAETAELLNVSEATVLRDWRAARAWLARELRGIS
ncbi:MAG TPA: ECF-type sigma factor [Vicinamibacterales bacterium]|jgi:RNA polymerase sigma factor (TIGR02999 family)|nr:ECF-type sigma factor [Vicinamibacterales bacterium]